MRRRPSTAERGSALLAVLWLSTALTVIAFSMGVTVRGDADRALAIANGIRAYYLAAGSIDRALLHLHWQPNQAVPQTMHFDYPAGTADIRLIPEKDKRDINTISPEAMFQVLTTLGAPADSSRLLADTRFAPAHPSIDNLEELLSFKGISPELYFGHSVYLDGKPTWRNGLRDCLTANSSDGTFTFIATADVSSARRSVAALVRLEPVGHDPFYHVLRWYDDAASMSIQPVTSTRTSSMSIQ